MPGHPIDDRVGAPQPTIFSPDNHSLSAGTMDADTVTAYVRGLDDLLDLAHRRAGRILTRAEFEEIVAGQTPFKVFPTLPMPDK